MEQKKRGPGVGRVLILLGVVLLLGAAGLYGYNRMVD